MNKKVTTIVEAAVLFILGILVAIYGGGTVLDKYFGVVCLVLGGALAILAIVLLATKRPLAPAVVLGGGALIGLGVGIFTEWFTIAPLINALVLVVLGGGAGLILYGIYTLTRGRDLVPMGIAQIVIGAVAVLIASLYLAIPDFRKAFWIIVGILMAVYAVLSVVFMFVFDKKNK